jgi:hypothetical protein
MQRTEEDASWERSVDDAHVTRLRLNPSSAVLRINIAVHTFLFCRLAICCIVAELCSNEISFTYLLMLWILLSIEFRSFHMRNADGVSSMVMIHCVEELLKVIG